MVLRVGVQAPIMVVVRITVRVTAMVATQIRV